MSRRWLEHVAGERQLSRKELLQMAAGGAAALAGGGLVPLGRQTSHAADTNGPGVVIEWNNAALQAIRETRPGPPMTARALAIVHTCMYDAWAAYHPVAVGTQSERTIRVPPSRSPAHRRPAICYAAYRALVDLFPSERSIFDALMARFGCDVSDTSTDSSPAGVGNRCAQAVLTVRHRDRSNQLGDLHWPPYSDWTGYGPVNPPEPAPVVDPNYWQPLSVPDGKGGYVTQSYIGPHWGLVTPFALTSGDQLRPPPPPITPLGRARLQPSPMPPKSTKSLSTAPT